MIDEALTRGIQGGTKRPSCSTETVTGRRGQRFNRRVFGTGLLPWLTCLVEYLTPYSIPCFDTLVVSCLRTNASVYGEVYIPCRGPFQ